MVGRWTAAILEAVGLRDCVVGNADAYVETAAGLARDGTRLGRIRTTLRERVLRSSLCDGGGRARQMERWYRAIWRRWCRRIQR
jgi:predicted O-linked N-acetylglucosamine transferase (SPINDLY family)